MKIGGGAVSGRATLRRSGDDARRSKAPYGDPSLSSAGASPAGSAAALDFASTGRSAAGLIAGLAGGGEVEFSGASLPRSDPAALDRVVAAAQATAPKSTRRTSPTRSAPRSTRARSRSRTGRRRSR